MYNSPVLAWTHAAPGSSQQQSQQHPASVQPRQVSVDEEYSQPSDAQGYMPAAASSRPKQQQQQPAFQVVPAESFYSEPTPAPTAPPSAAIGFRPIQPAGVSAAAKPQPAKVPALSVLNHHPASPFEPVQQRVKPGPLSGAARPSTIISAQPLAAERLPSSTGSAVAAAASAPTSSALAPTATGGSLYGDTADSSYEEAWDIRMQKRGITLGGRPLAPAAAAPAAAAGAAPQAAAPGEPDYDYAYGSGGGELRHAMQRSLSLQDHQGGGDARPAVPARSVAATAAAGHPPMLQERRSDEDRVSIGSYDEPWEGGGAAAAAVGRAFLPVETHRTAAQTVQKPVVPGFPIAVPPPVPPHKTQQQHQQHQSGSPPVRLRSTVAASGIRQSQPAQLVRQESGPAAAASGASSSSSEPLIDSNLALSDQPWFYEVGVNRQSAESLLKAYPEGAFLVRTCESDTGQYSLSLRGRIGSQFLHMKIERNKAGQFVLGQYSQPFQSVPLMIRHYTSNILPIKGADQMILKMPVVRAGRRPQPTGNNHYV
ncbi:hypothetical protein BOX15_Mlig014291g1 [Macrostomum lignano]|uniref:SH2 domain-containing protein n=1 Tax=Macrostomum lignano TaxID=282301 RepID=A0A267EQW4_9PLAT|nr:hypothetical protein BOX15_Mlig014291g1 [Macrostomum lignano]